MDWKKVGNAFLFPPIAVLILLLPIAATFLVYSMVVLEETDLLRVASYVLAFYTLTIWCVRVPEILRFVLRVKNTRYISVWLSDPRLRMNVILSGNVLWNVAYAALQLGLGVYYKPGEKMREELTRYRICGWIFLFMNLVLTGMMFYMIRYDRMVRHHEITTITMAAYTFTSLVLAIGSVIRYHRYNSPAWSASKAISLAAACVSVLTLENTMLATFSSENMTRQIRRLFLGISGSAISAFIIVMAIYMIVQSNRKMKDMETKNGK